MTILMAIYLLVAGVVLGTAPSDVSYVQRIVTAITWPLWYTVGLFLLILTKL